MVTCADGTFYTGITTDVDRRLRQHNGKIVGGAKYTAVRRPVVLSYQFPCGDRSSAQKKEHIIKKMTRMEKQELIHQNLEICDKLETTAD